MTGGRQGGQGRIDEQGRIDDITDAARDISSFLNDKANRKKPQLIPDPAQDLLNAPRITLDASTSVHKLCVVTGSLHSGLWFVGGGGSAKHVTRPE